MHFKVLACSPSCSSTPADDDSDFKGHHHGRRIVLVSISTHDFITMWTDHIRAVDGVMRWQREPNETASSLSTGIVDNLHRLRKHLDLSTYGTSSTA